MRERWEADERPEPRSLGLLPSGPDPVGEWLVHRQPPASISAQRNGNASGRQPQSTAGFLPWVPSSCACLLEKRRDDREGFVALLEHAGKEIEAVWHAFTNEVLDLSDPCRAQFLREGAVVVDERIGRASGDERCRIFAQVGPRRAGVRVRPVFAVDEIGAADEPDEGGIIDDAERPKALERLVLFEEEIRDRGEQHRGLRWRDAFIARFDHERSGDYRPLNHLPPRCASRLRQAWRPPSASTARPRGNHRGTPETATP